MHLKRCLRNFFRWHKVEKLFSLSIRGGLTHTSSLLKSRALLLIRPLKLCSSAKLKTSAAVSINMCKLCRATKNNRNQKGSSRNLSRMIEKLLNNEGKRWPIKKQNLLRSLKGRKNNLLRCMLWSRRKRVQSKSNKRKLLLKTTRFSLRTRRLLRLT